MSFLASNALENTACSSYIFGLWLRPCWRRKTFASVGTLNDTDNSHWIDKQVFKADIQLKSLQWYVSFALFKSCSFLGIHGMDIWHKWPWWSGFISICFPVLSRNLGWIQDDKKIDPQVLQWNKYVEQHNWTWNMPASSDSVSKQARTLLYLARSRHWQRKESPSTLDKDTTA